jgi:hypothetical protein
MLTALRQARGRYLVRAYGILPGFPVARFDRLDDAVAYADHLAPTCPGASCVICQASDGAVVYRTLSHRRPWPKDAPGGEGTDGVREPRRPVPGSSAGSIALDLPA